MAFIAKLGEQSYTVEIEETGKSLYRLSVDGPTPLDVGATPNLRLLLRT